MLSGTPYPELTGTYQLASSSGFVSEISFHGKGFFSGTRNSFEAKMYRHDDRSNSLYTVSGQWNDKFTIHDVERDEHIDTYESAKQPSVVPYVEDVDEQDPWESRRAWRGVIESLNKGDMSGTVRAKSKVEQGQRNMRKDEEKTGQKWKPAFYINEHSDPIFEKLAAMTGDELHAEKTMGVWKLDSERVGRLQKPYHKGLVPTNTALEGESPSSTPRGSIDHSGQTNEFAVNSGRASTPRGSIDQSRQTNGHAVASERSSTTHGRIQLD